MSWDDLEAGEGESEDEAEELKGEGEGDDGPVWGERGTASERTRIARA